MSVPARYEFLDGLVKDLTPHEWRYLRDRLMQRCFHCDVMGKLPLELAIIVAAYLDPVDIVASRRVSRRWHSLLTAKEVARQVCLNSFPPQDLPDSTDWTQYLDQRSCREHTLACGRPWSQADFFDGSLDMTGGNTLHGQLHGSHFAWCATPTPHELREHICVLSLGNGTVSRYFPSTRSLLKPETIALSDVLVGCTSLNGRVLPYGFDRAQRHCEIFDILKGTCYSFRLPSTRYEDFVLQGDKVACINSDIDRFTSTASLDIITWDIISKEHRRTSLEVSLEMFGGTDQPEDRLDWILGYDSIHVIAPGASAQVFITEIGVSIYHAQDADISLDICSISEISVRQGRVIATQRVRIADTKSTWLHADESSSSSSTKQKYVIIPQQEPRTNWSYYFKLALLDCWVYSLKTEHLIDRSRDRPAPRYYRAPRPLSPSTYWVMPSMASRVIRFITWQRGQELVREVVPEFSEKEAVGELEHVPSIGDGLEHRCALMNPSLLHSSIRPIRDKPVFGNHSFFILSDCGRIRVYCFDRNFVLPNENLLYRSERQEKARARKAKIRHESHFSENLKSCPNMASC